MSAVVGFVWAQFPSDAAHVFPLGSNGAVVSHCGRVTAVRAEIASFPEMDGERCAECLRRLAVAT